MIVEPSDVELQARRARDRALVEAHCSGDTRAFTVIVADHYRVLLAQAERRLGDRGAAEDAVQETFERAFRAVCRLGRDGEYRLGAWLSRILANVCADLGNRIVADRNLSERVAREVPEADLGESFSDPYILRAVREAIAALPSSQRDTFLLKEMDGLSYPQIADRLEISEDNARARVHRARATLRRSLALTRAMFGAVIAVPVGVRSLFRRTREYTPAGQGAAEMGSGSTAQTLAAHVAASPVGQMVASVAPSGAFRGSVIAGIASIAVTGAIAIPAVTSSDHSRPTRAETVSVQGADGSTTTLAPPPTVAATADGAAPAEGLARAGDILSGTVTDATKPWWTEFFAVAFGGEATDAPSDGASDPATPMPDLCATSSPLSAASAPRSVVSTLDLPAAAVAAQGDNVYTFDAQAALVAGEGASAELSATATACLAPDGTYGSLVVELTDGTSTVALAGTSRYAKDGTWVFRGTATSPAGELPWLVHREFIARLVLAGEGEDQTATLSFAFLDDEGSTAPQGDPDPIVVPPTTTMPPTTTPPTTVPPTTTTPPPAPSEGSEPAPAQ